METDRRNLILVVGLDSASREQTCSQIGELYPVHLAATFIEAETAIQLLRPQVAIIDLNLGCAAEALEFLSARQFPDSAIAILTSEPVSDPMECDFLEAGAAWVLRRPVFQRKMRLLVQRMLELYKTTEQLKLSEGNMAIIEQAFGNLRRVTELCSSLVHPRA